MFGGKSRKFIWDLKLQEKFFFLQRYLYKTMNTSICNFLSNSKCLLESSHYSLVHVVLGNEACDLDSAVSAIVYAYNLFTLTSMEGSPEHVAEIIIPVLNIPRKEYRLRTEITFTMEKLDIDCRHLVFIDEIDLLGLKEQGKLAVTLVDHHVLSQGQAELNDNLVEIIDHRKDQTPSSSSYTKTIELVGSCSTLVAEKILQNNRQVLDSQVSYLLLSSILLDTVNLDPRAGRKTDKDVEIVNQLKNIFKDDLFCDELYSAVNKAKFDTSGLTNSEILRKDYKDVPQNPKTPLKIGISSITLSMEQLLRRVNIESDLKEFSNLKKLDTLVVMTLYFKSLDGPPFRQIAVFSDNEKRVERLSKFLKDKEILQLEELDFHTLRNCLCFDQRNVKASRKIVLPLVMDFLDQ